MDLLEQPSSSYEEKSRLILLPYHGKKDGFGLKSMRKRL